MSSDPSEHSIALDRLILELSALPHPEQTHEGLRMAVKLVEASAYAYAKHKSGFDVVQMLLIAEDLDRTLEKHVKNES